jgi:hypothetical protein
MKTTVPLQTDLISYAPERSLLPDGQRKKTYKKPLMATQISKK